MIAVERLKAQWRERVEPLRETGDHILSELEISAYIGGGFDAINVVTPALVAAVERVQALHTPNQFGHCIHCSHIAEAHVDHPCDTIQALEEP